MIEFADIPEFIERLAKLANVHVENIEYEGGG